MQRHSTFVRGPGFGEKVLSSTKTGKIFVATFINPFTYILKRITKNGSTSRANVSLQTQIVAP